MRKRMRRHELAAFHDKVLVAFYEHKLRCDCGGITHDLSCPLGELEAPAEELRQWVAEMNTPLTDEEHEIVAQWSR